jgi:hypothetical protein
MSKILSDRRVANSALLLTPLRLRIFAQVKMIKIDISDNETNS